VARVDRRRAQREARHARTRGTRRSRGGSRTVSARTVEQTLFFTRLRRQAKWAFALMVIVFAVGFAFLGVGSGGLDLQSLVQDVFGSKGGGGTSVSKAQKEVAKHPNDPTAYKKLYEALKSKGRTQEAITALEHYVKLRPRDVEQLQNLALLENQAATNALQSNQIARFNQQNSRAGGIFGSAIPGADPIENAVSAQVTKDERSTFESYRKNANLLLGTLTRLAKLQNDSSSYTRLAQNAAQFGYPAKAIAAYKKALKLETDPRLKAQIRAQLKALRSGTATTGG
jgi:tetratricopeptide (TPR) repeat protein